MTDGFHLLGLPQLLLRLTAARNVCIQCHEPAPRHGTTAKLEHSAGWGLALHCAGTPPRPEQSHPARRLGCDVHCPEFSGGNLSPNYLGNVQSDMEYLRGNAGELWK